MYYQSEIRMLNESSLSTGELAQKYMHSQWFYQGKHGNFFELPKLGIQKNLLK
jgi:hypothetical protein